MKMKYILPILCLLFTFVSCQGDNTPPPPNPNPNYTEVGPSMEFVHPGILHTTAAITRMQNFVNGNVSPAIRLSTDCCSRILSAFCSIYNSRHLSQLLLSFNPDCLDSSSYQNLSERRRSRSSLSERYHVVYYPESGARSKVD